MREMIRRMRRLARQDEGTSLVEYGMLLLLIAAICILVITAIGTKVSNGWETTNGLLP